MLLLFIVSDIVSRYAKLMVQCSIPNRLLLTLTSLFYSSLLLVKAGRFVVWQVSTGRGLRPLSKFQMRVVEIERFVLLKILSVKIEFFFFNII